MRRLTCIVALATATSACIQVGGSVPPADVSGAGEVPFALAGRGGAALVVPVHINDEGPYQFVLDTGATLTCVDTKLAEHLNLPTPVGTFGYGATVSDTGMIGLRQMDTLAVGPATASGLTACELDLGRMRQVGLEVDGLLGLNFLKSFKVTLDFERQVLTLER